MCIADSKYYTLNSFPLLSIYFRWFHGSLPSPPTPHKPRALISRNFKLVGQVQRDQRGVAPADCWNWGEWGLTGYKWKRSFLGGFVGLIVPVQETVILPWLIWSAQYKIFFPHRTLFQFMCPHRHATWAGSRAGPPVSECVSPVRLGVLTLLLYLFSKARAL